MASPQRKPVNKKKIVPMKSVRIGSVDYKDIALLRKFISERGKIRARRVTGLSVQDQRKIAIAVKNAREMALLPYTKRVSQTRAGRPGRDGEERRPRRDDAPKAEVVVDQVDDAVTTDTEAVEA